MKSKALVILAFILGLVSNASALPIIGLTDQNELVTFNSDNPATIDSTVSVTGLQDDEVIVAIDLNLKTGELLGLSSSDRLFRIDHLTGVAVLLQDDPLVESALESSATLEIDPNPGGFESI